MTGDPIASESKSARSQQGRRPTTLAVVPALNEAASISAVVSSLLELEGVDVCVVDDGSTDGTGRIAREAGARVVTLPFNVGIGGAVQVGYRLALQESYSVTVQVDGDGQHPASELPGLVAALEQHGVDFVIGSRFLDDSGYRASRARRVGIALFRAVLTRCCGTKLTDTTSGFRAAGPRAIALFARSYPHDYPEVESIVLAARSGLRIIETPVSMRQRAAGVSSITPVRSVYYVAKVLLAVAIQVLRPVAEHREVR